MVETKDFKIGVIYMYTSPSGKRYIGQTINERSRKSQHKKNSVKTQTKFARAIQKYGFENLKYRVIIKFKPTSDLEKLKRVLNKLETRYIKLYDSIKSGYNLTGGGDSALHSEESIEKMRDYANNMTDEHKKNLSIAAKNRSELEMADPEKRSKIINNLLKGQKTERGPMPEETKRKVSESHKNKKGVKQYDLEMNLVNTFISIGDAARSIETDATFKTKSNRISECISSKRRTAYNYIWISE